MKALVVYDTNDRVYFVRITESDGSSTPLCTGPSKREAELVARCVNAVLKTDADLCMKASRAIYEFVGINLRDSLADIPADIHG